MKTKPLAEIKRRLAELNFPEKFEMVVGIGRGGIVPAYLAAAYLKLPVELVWISFRDEHHRQMRKTPKPVRPPDFEWKDKKILVVDDRANSGRTLRLAKQMLSGAGQVKTLVINGRADYSLFNEDCFRMPWEWE